MISRIVLKIKVPRLQPEDWTINPHHYRSFDHGYAVTIHKSQGATVDRSYVLASKSMDHSLAYVAMTRHRSDMKLYLNAKDQPLWMDRDHPNLAQAQLRATPDGMKPDGTSQLEPPKPSSPAPHRKRPGPSR
jgi:ATP-dependent exoDNAse (exonuclease V) alpha subunit